VVLILNESFCAVHRDLLLGWNLCVLPSSVSAVHSAVPAMGDLCQKEVTVHFRQIPGSQSEVS
jgi:hypothetical protein